MKKPNVLVAGFPKSGSTYLYHLLKQHPDIFIPKIKEINYFNKDNFFLSNPEILNPRYFKPISWYYDFFDTNKKTIIDFSILSAFDLVSAKRVKKELGDVKIIFITRNKKDYLMSIKKFVEKEGGDPKVVDKYEDVKFYIDNYKKYFSKILIIKLESINKDPKKELDRITKFLNLKNHNFSIEMNSRSKHETKTYKMNFSQKIKRNIYFGIVRFFYKMISLSVTAKLKAQGEK